MKVRLSLCQEQQKVAGRNWKAWSSRLIGVKLKVVGRDTDRSFIQKKKQNKNLHSLTNFQAMSTVPERSYYVLFGNFNAHEGSRDSENEKMIHERGPHGHGILCDAGRELL